MLGMEPSAAYVRAKYACHFEAPPFLENRMKPHLLSAAAMALALVACGKPAAPTETAVVEAAAPAPAPELEVNYAPAGTYKLDKGHASVIWRVRHMGLSNYTGRFTDFDATLVYNPADTAASGLTATINPASAETDYPGDYKAGHADSKFKTWDEDLIKNDKWFNALTHKSITFEATEITKITGSTGTVTGNLTFLGVTKPVTLDVTYNGTAVAPWAPETDKIGFSGRTVLKRSEFGMGQGIPLIGDEVEVIIEAEFDEVPA
jgi:polyisoprenoid-binding protein YceI